MKPDWVTWLPSTCQVSDSACSTSRACSIQYSAQRWFAFRDIGPGPCGRSSHAMASDGTRIFLLGGALSTGAKANESELLYVLDTSMYFLLTDSTIQSADECTERITFQDPTPTIPILARRPLNSCESHQRVPRPSGNQNNLHSRRQTRMSTQNTVLLLFKKLPLENQRLSADCSRTKPWFE